MSMHESQLKENRKLLIKHNKIKMSGILTLIKQYKNMMNNKYNLMLGFKIQHNLILKFYLNQLKFIKSLWTECKLNINPRL